MEELDPILNAELIKRYRIYTAQKRALLNQKEREKNGTYNIKIYDLNSNIKEFNSNRGSYTTTFKIPKNTINELISSGSSSGLSGNDLLKHVSEGLMKLEEFKNVNHPTDLTEKQKKKYDMFFDSPSRTFPKLRTEIEIRIQKLIRDGDIKPTNETSAVLIKDPSLGLSEDDKLALTVLAGVGENEFKETPVLKTSSGAIRVLSTNPDGSIVYKKHVEVLKRKGDAPTYVGRYSKPDDKSKKVQLEEVRTINSPHLESVLGPLSEGKTIAGLQSTDGEQVRNLNYNDFATMYSETSTVYDNDADRNMFKNASIGLEKFNAYATKEGIPAVTQDESGSFEKQKVAINSIGTIPREERRASLETHARITSSAVDKLTKRYEKRKGAPMTEGTHVMLDVSARDRYGDYKKYYLRLEVDENGNVTNEKRILHKKNSQYESRVGRVDRVVRENPDFFEGADIRESSLFDRVLTEKERQKLKTVLRDPKYKTSEKYSKLNLEYYYDLGYENEKGKHKTIGIDEVLKDLEDNNEGFNFDNYTKGINGNTTSNAEPVVPEVNKPSTETTTSRLDNYLDKPTISKPVKYGSKDNDYIAEELKEKDPEYWTKSRLNDFFKIPNDDKIESVDKEPNVPEVDVSPTTPRSDKYIDEPVTPETIDSDEITEPAIADEIPDEFIPSVTADRITERYEKERGKPLPEGTHVIIDAMIEDGSGEDRWNSVKLEVDKNGNVTSEETLLNKNNSYHGTSSTTIDKLVKENPSFFEGAEIRSNAFSSARVLTSKETEKLKSALKNTKYETSKGYSNLRVFAGLSIKYEDEQGNAQEASLDDVIEDLSESNEGFNFNNYLKSEDTPAEVIDKVIADELPTLDSEKVKVEVSTDSEGKETFTIINKEDVGEDGEESESEGVVIAEGTAEEIKEDIEKVIAPILKATGLPISAFKAFPNTDPSGNIVMGSGYSSPTDVTSVEDKKALATVAEINTAVAKQTKAKAAPKAAPKAKVTKTDPNYKGLNDLVETVAKDISAIRKQRKKSGKFDAVVEVTKTSPDGEESIKTVSNKMMLNHARRLGYLSSAEIDRLKNSPMTPEELKKTRINSNRYNVKLAPKDSPTEYVLVDTKSGVERPIGNEVILAIDSKRNKLVVAGSKTLDKDLDLDRHIPLSKETIGDYINNDQVVNSKMNTEGDTNKAPTESTTDDAVKKTSTLGEKLNKFFKEDLVTGDKIGLAAQSAPALFNVARGLIEKAEEYSPIHNSYAKSALNDMRQRRFNVDRTPGRLMDAKLRSDIQNNSTGNASRMANLANAAASAKRQEDALSVQEANVNQMQLPGENANFALNVGQSEQQARATARGLNIQSKAAKDSMLTTGLTQFGNVGQQMSNIANHKAEGDLMKKLMATGHYEIGPDGMPIYIGPKYKDPNKQKTTATKQGYVPLGSAPNRNTSGVGNAVKNTATASGNRPIVKGNAPINTFNTKPSFKPFETPTLGTSLLDRDYTALTPLDKKYDFNNPINRDGGQIDVNKMKLDSLKRLKNKLKRLKKL